MARPDLHKPDSSRSGGTQRDETIETVRGAGVRLLGGLVKEHRKRLVSVLAILVVSAVSGSAVPILIQRAIDDGVVASDQSALRLYVALFCLATVVSSIAAGMRLWLVTVTGQDILHEVRRRAATSLGALPIAKYERIRRGDIVARLTSDVESLQASVTQGLPFVVSAMIRLVAGAAGMAIVSPIVAAMMLLVVPPLALSGRWMSKRSRQIYPLARKRNGEMVAELSETLEGAAEIRAFGRASDRNQQFGIANEATVLAALDGMSMRSCYFLMTAWSQAAVTAVVVLVASMLAIQERLSVGVVAAALIGLTRVFEPLLQLVWYIDSVQSARAALDRVAGVVALDSQPADESAPSSYVDEIGGMQQSQSSDIELVDVDYEYVPGRPVLTGVNLYVAAGTQIAITGPTGAGKSTLARLMAGLAPPTSGTVRVGGQDVASLHRTQRRSLVVTVVQEGFCIEGTIADNVRLGDQDADDEAVSNALRNVGAHWISGLEYGINTEIGSTGVGLSDGQRQILSLARVALLDPSVLILDEATSLLDPITEAEVAASLERLFQGRTVVVIAHRQATAARCDRIINVVDGVAIEEMPEATK